MSDVRIASGAFCARISRVGAREPAVGLAWQLAQAFSYTAAPSAVWANAEAGTSRAINSRIRDIRSLLTKPYAGTDAVGADRSVRSRDLDPSERKRARRD